MLAAGVALGVLLLYVTLVLAPHAAERKDFGFSLEPADGPPRVTAVRRDGPANGLLQTGDVVLSWNGDEGIQEGDAASYFYRQAAAPFTLTIERAGEARQVALTPAEISNPGEPARTIILACIATVWAALGLAVIALGPNDRATLLCAAFMILMAASQFGISLADIDRPVGAVQMWIRVAGFAAYPWHIVFAFLMASTVAGIALPFSKIVIVAAAATYTIASAPRVLHLFNPNAVATIADVTLGWQGVVGRFAILAGLFATVASLTMALRRSQQQITRRRIGWMVAGITPAAAAYAISAAISVAARTRPDLEPVYDRALLATLLVSLSVPLAFAYAVARHELFGVRIVIRMSIQYALARSALLWMLAIPVIGLVWTIWREPDLTVRGLLSAGTPHFYLLIVIALSLASRERLLAAIDRRFFRDARDRDRILLDLASEIGRTDTVEDAVELAEHALDASLHPGTARVRLYDKGRPFPADLATTDTQVLHRLQAGEEIQSDHADVAIIVPILNRDRRLIGTMSLGPKRSEEPYSAGDRQLLRAMALQIAMAAENAALRKEVGDERKIRHEVLRRLDKNAVHVIRECPRCGTVFDHDAETCPADHSALVPTLPVERTIGGRYRLDRLIGRGAMGAVYEAEDVSMTRLVAVKILQADCFGDDGALRRFEREARILGSLSQPNVVAIHDHGSLSAGGAYLVMERLYGSTWRASLREQGTIEPRTLRVWLNQLCDALVAAHAKGVVHRDLKPENIIIQQGDRTQLKVLDFGIAKLTSGQSDTDGTSASGMVIGTLGYMAPEQLAGKPVDVRADIFAVGVMTWEALCGSRPFQGTTAAELAIAMQKPPIAPSDGFGSVLSEVLEHSLAADPHRRPASALELKQRLNAAINA